MSIGTTNYLENLKKEDRSTLKRKKPVVYMLEKPSTYVYSVGNVIIGVSGVRKTNDPQISSPTPLILKSL